MRSILLIEDDHNLGLELKSFLEESSYEVDWATSGKKAVQFIDVKPYDVYLLDIGLPDCSGLDLCNMFRQRFQEPIIMLTACDSEDDIVNGLAAGADDYVTKPYSLRVLQSRIETQFRRRIWENARRDVGEGAREEGKDETSLLTGDLAIDLEHCTITRKGELLPVSNIEFQLCVALVRSDGQIMPRGLLLDKIWDEREQFIEDNTLSVHVSRLRKKLGLYGDKLYIDTIKGIGYRWNIAVVGK